MNIKQQLRIILTMENLTLVTLANLLTKETGRKWYPSSIATRLKKGTFRYDEMKYICDLLGYEIIIKKREK